MTEPEIDGPRRRGILVLLKKNLGLKVARIEEQNYNLVKISLEHKIMKMKIYGCYGHSDGDKHEYFLDLRRQTLEDDNEEILMIGDWNATLCPTKDRWNYTTDNHKKCRTVINNCIDEGDYMDVYRTFNPDGKSYTYRVREAETRKIIRQSRLDYALASRQLFGRVTEIQHINPPFSFSDHSGKSIYRTRHHI